MPSSKKDRKNGKEGSKVVAELTKHAPKFTNDNKESPKDSPKGPSPSPSSPPVHSPELKPIIPSNGHPGASPLLDAVSTTSFATSTSPSMKEWTKGAPAGMAGSPGNLISLMGESPPTQPSSYEDSRVPRSGWSSPRPSANYNHAFGASPPTASPPTRTVRRPLSFQSENRYSPPDVQNHLGNTAAAARRSSMHSHFAAHPRGSLNPPLPHQPQAHFYGVENIDNFDIYPTSGLKAGERGYYFGFDVLPCLNGDHGPGKDNVVLAGYEGGLEVHSRGQRGLEHIASLKGLRGGVCHAKILPWTVSGADLFPLVAIVVHGPAIPPAPPAPPGINVEDEYDAVSAERSSAISNVNDDLGGRGPSPGFIETYQTTVEVYSLKTNRLVQVLLEAPKVPLQVPITSPIFKPPPPSGAFTIKADGSNLIVSSGITGECWAYRQMMVQSEQRVQFVCLGKVWTTLQHSQKGEPTETERIGASPQPPHGPQSAIISLHGQWLAYCPAAPQSQVALRASVPVPLYGKATGLASLAPPHLPPVNSDVDLPNPESMVNKIMRDATQELILGAKWVGKQGLQAWNRYWSPPSQQPARSPPPGTQGWAQRPDLAQFPPTHGTVTQPTLPKEPGLISVLDIETLGTTSSHHPVVTFQVPHGCSFLSLAPTGLLLFTASSKGDVQTVWDLKRIQHTKSSSLQPSTIVAAGIPRIRQVAQFSRMTVARIFDVAWTRPKGQRAAMVTERGTVHLFDLPSSAFTWPPPRRRAHDGEGQVAGVEGGVSAVAMASNALTSVRDAARPLITRHGRSVSNAVSGSGFVDQAAHGGKVIVAGISHSLGRTGNAINQLRHTGENRVSLPGTITSTGLSCVVWIRNRKRHQLYVLGDGLMRTFPNKGQRAGGRGDKHRRLRRYRDFKLRNLPDDTLALTVQAFLDPEDYLERTAKELEVGNNAILFSDRQTVPNAYKLHAGSAIPQAEIESSAPYQPFHTDRRVALYESEGDSNTDEQSTSLSVLLENTTLDDKVTHTSSKRKSQQRQQPSPPPSDDSDEAWVFGQPLNATKLDLGFPAFNEEASFTFPSDDSRALPPSAMERVYHHVGTNEQIVVTTRRRRGAGRGADADDDGFFEDDCEVLDFADQRV